MARSNLWEAAVGMQVTKWSLLDFSRLYISPSTPSEGEWISGRWSPGAMEEKLSFFKFINNKIVIQNSSTFSETAGTGGMPLT